MLSDIEKYVNHETRIRLLETLEDKLTNRFSKLEEKIDTQFYWLMGTILTLFGGILLHMANLI